MGVHTKQYMIQLFMMILVSAQAASQTMPHCPSSCGSLSNIPYPFGTREGCYLDDTFFINCTHNSSTTIPFLRHGNITVLNISLDGELVVSSHVARDCYGAKGNALIESSRSFELQYFYISSNRNKFIAIGCDTVGTFIGYVPRTKNYTTGNACLSICNRPSDIVTDGSCSGSGCCQNSITEGISGFQIRTSTISNHSIVHKFNPCGYAFVVEDGAYSFSSKDLQNFDHKTIMPVVLDWAVGNQTCEEAQRNMTSYACKAENSECHNSNNGVGYRCKCRNGFQGNPYLLHGCEDINECNMEPNPCSRVCKNFPGGFECSCPVKYEGDGMRNGTGCQRKKKSRGPLILIIALSMSLGLLALVVGSLYLYCLLRKRKVNKIRENYFQQNGGTLLLQKIAGLRGSSERATIFTAEELNKATNNYDEVRVIGKGGHGTVYKGILSDGRVVAIKKSKISSQNEIEQFINEVVVLSQINHRNVVKLLGCCLETEVPLLVYEFITNGTLSEHIHVETGQAYQLSWTTRLRVATETAEALAYLHSAASTPIIHRDVKTANILLDDNLSAKVSDFGASKLVPLDQSQITTLVQGTLGYLDPEYFQTSQLTDKSDVYSFGVVLAELLTSMKALSFVRPESDRNLSMFFVSTVKEDRLPHILDKDIVNDGNFEQITGVANLAKRCLMLKGEERPTMKEVAMELERIRIVEKHSLGATDYMWGDKTVSNLKTPPAGGSGSGSITTGFHSMQKIILKELRDGR